MTEVQGRVLVSGTATGPVLATAEPLSFWGGYDPLTGEVIDRRHPLSGTIASGTILVLPFIRGSSTSTAILLEAITNGTSPAALVTTGSDPFMVLAAVVADELFQKRLPVVSVDRAGFDAVGSWDRASLEEGGRLVSS